LSNKSFVKTQDNDGNWLQPLPEIADSQSVLADAVRSQGEDYYMPLLWQDGQTLPFAVWLSWLHQRCVLRSAPICTQSNPAGLSDQVRQAIDTTIPQLHRHPLTAIAHGLNQRWLHPITDFSIPPQQVYTLISAQTLLQRSHPPELSNLSHQTVMIIPAYPEASILGGSELFTPPAAVEYWYGRADPPTPYRQMTSGEHHAYLFYQFLNRRIVTPIPDLWLVWLAALTGKFAVLYLQRRDSRSIALQSTARSPFRRWRRVTILAGGTIGYTLISLELYASAALLLPIVLPTLTLWLYLLPVLVKQRSKE
jgi:hypothetical protein